MIADLAQKCEFFSVQEIGETKVKMQQWEQKEWGLLIYAKNLMTSGPSLLKQIM